MISGLGYNQRDVQKCQVNGLVYVPFTGRCETPEIARQIIAAAQKRGLGFLSWDDPTEFGNDWEWWIDDAGNYWQSDWFFEPSGNPTDYYQALDTGFWVGDDGTLYTLNPDDAMSSSFAQPTGQPSYRDITGSLDYRDAWSWLTDLLNPGPGPVAIDPQYDSTNNGPLLPGYCAKGTYHPINDPFACVPFPNDDATKKKAAATQRAGQQQQARQAQKAQQQASQTCPKDPQGRAVWRNPATQKCELVPQCPSGQKFDQVTRRCLTTAQRNELYGNQSSWLWWIVGGVLFLLYVGNRRGNESSTPWRRKKR